MANEITKSQLTDAASAMELMKVANRYVQNGISTLNEAAADESDDFIKAGQSALESCARWIRETIAILPLKGDTPLSDYQRDKTWVTYDQAKRTMSILDQLVGDKFNWVDEFVKSCRVVVGTVASTVGEVLGTAGSIAGGAAGNAVGGILKGLGWTAVILGGIIGVALVIQKRVG